MFYQIAKPQKLINIERAKINYLKGVGRVSIPTILLNSKEEVRLI